MPIVDAGQGAQKKRTLIQTIPAAPGQTDWIGLSGPVIVQVNSPDGATACSVIVERSTTGPSDPLGPLIAPADASPIGGNPTTGISPALYTEAGVAWWRARVAPGGMTGGTLTVSISGSVVG